MATVDSGKDDSVGSRDSPDGGGPRNGERESTASVVRANSATPTIVEVEAEEDGSADGAESTLSNGEVVIDLSRLSEKPESSSTR